jgi:hypothetical protein
MFQIVTNSTLPDVYLENKQSISVPCFYLTNDNSLTSTIELSNFTPMFIIESTDEESIEVEDFNYQITTIPSQYMMLELDIDSMEPLDDISTLYLNGSKYQNLLEVEELILFTDTEEAYSIEEREST